jgi:DNA-binding NtrC family response regulator
VRRVAQHALRAAEVECTVLISGETGTGKEIWARVLHRSGPRANKPLVPVNCAALTSTLAESQLFGHEKGAFTGALGSALGVFRSADGGVAFLDEIGEMPLELQPKLLRVLQQREVTPVGASHPVPIDVQVLAATNRDLEAEVSAGRFREDLFYRLNMVELRVPPLRDRVDDIPEMIEFLSVRFAKKYLRPLWRPDAETLRDFCEFDWPGNIRQLSHVIEQAYVLDSQPMLPRGAASNRGPTSLPFFNLARLRNEAVRQALGATRGHKGRAAKLLGVHPNTLTRLISQPEPCDDEPAPS